MSIRVAHAEPLTNPARRSPVGIDAAILAELAMGPLMKWEIRERIYEPESIVKKHLLALRVAGLIKVVGKRLDKRRWALKAWQPTNAPWRTTLAVVPKVKPMPDTGSWWLDLPPEQFYREASSRAEHMAASKEAKNVPFRILL